MKRQALVAIALLPLAGCVTQHPSGAGFSSAPSSANQPHADINGLDVVTNPVAKRLDDIAGNLLMYDALYHQFPAKLEDLQTIASADQPLQITNPRTGQPFVYTPRGLAVTGEPSRLIVYTEPAEPDGTRWGIMLLPTHPGQPPQLNIVHLNSIQFAHYLPVAE